MTETLGKLDRPEASSFRLGRKLILVPLIFPPPDDDTAKLSSLVKQYWAEASEQVNKLAGTLGGVKKVYHELVPTGEDSMAVLANVNPGSHDLVKTTIERGATMAETEDPETLAEFLDWGRCLSLRLESPRVFSDVYGKYSQAMQKRNESIGRKIDESLNNDELGLVLLREEHRVQFPSDIQVFYVAPPAMDIIARHTRDLLEKTLPETESKPAEPNISD